MADNILLPFEGLCAGVAGEKPLGTMDVLFMDLQVAAVSKGLQAGLTAIDDICFNSVVRTGQESSNRLQQQEHKCSCLSYHDKMEQAEPLEHIKLLLLYSHIFYSIFLFFK